MRNKKLLSTVLTASLVATTMAMPVMAAGESGSIDISVGSKVNVLRVQVPTSLAVEIDQYETDTKGSQVASQAFDMTNYSNINVSVAVKSHADTGAGVQLVGTKNDAVTSTSGDAWLAVAAKTSLKTQGISQYGVTESLAELTESSTNVATFDTSGDAEQTFYLQSATGIPSYIGVTSGDVAEDQKTHTEFYKLEGALKSGDAVIKQVRTKDVYVWKSGDATKNLKRIPMNPKADNSGDIKEFSDGDTAYTVTSGDAVISSGIKAAFASDANAVYMYGEASTPADQGQAAFRYVGKLAGEKKWGKNDIPTIKLTYTISGVEPEKYDEVSAKCTQGLYNASAPATAAPSIGVKSYKLTADTAVPINVNLGGGDLAATKVVGLKNGASDLPSDAWTYSNGVLTITAARVNTLVNAGVSRTYTVVFNDKAGTKVDIVLDGTK